MLRTQVQNSTEIFYDLWCEYLGKLRLRGNHTVTENEMSGDPYNQKCGWINHSNELVFQVMTFK